MYIYWMKTIVLALGLNRKQSWHLVKIKMKQDNISAAQSSKHCLLTKVASFANSWLAQVFRQRKFFCAVMKNSEWGNRQQILCWLVLKLHLSWIRWSLCVLCYSSQNTNIHNLGMADTEISWLYVKENWTGTGRRVQVDSYFFYLFQTWTPNV